MWGIQGDDEYPEDMAKPRGLLLINVVGKAPKLHVKSGSVFNLIAAS